MNLHVPSPAGPAQVGLRAEDFWMLKQSGAFAGYVKSELLEGELWGAPREADGSEPESDAVYPIRLRVEDYEKLDRAGAFASHGKTELVDGFIFRMSPQFRPHGFVKDELAYRLRRALEDLGSPLHVATEQSVDLPPHSEPQPDIILTTEPQGEGAIPGRSVALIVEVSATTLAFDLGEKARIYAGAGIPEYWVVDLVAARILRMWLPQGETYAEHDEWAFGAPVESVTIAGLRVDTMGLR